MAEHLASAIEATRLGPGVTLHQVEELAADAVRRGLAGVCVPGRYLQPWVRQHLRDTDLAIVSVAAFPFGDAPVLAVAEEIRTLVAQGATEVDVVAPLGLALSGEWSGYGAALERFVRAAAEDGARLKVILETAALEGDSLERAAEAALRAGVDWLKTSTGFHPAGGATLDAVRRLRAMTRGTACGVKASGGIRTREQALSMLEAGADRIGTSSVAAILD